jgi:hypothetical protein
VHRPSIALALAAVATLVLAPAASAHTGIEVGDYLVSVGWKNEPPYVGQPNAVQVTIVDSRDESPITDVPLDALSVVVSTAGQDSPSLPLTAAFDAEEGTGPLGEYDAALVPTAPGDYRFHVTGMIHGTAVDIDLASGDETFDPVTGSSDLEFPAKLPNLTEVATRLDRIDGRIAALQSAGPGSGGGAAGAATEAARMASASADRALVVGSLVGGAGVVIALVALLVGARSRRGARA